MGMFYSNIHIRKGAGIDTEHVKTQLIKLLQSKDYRQVQEEKDADISLLIYDSPQSEWISACSDAFDFCSAADIRPLCAPLSAALCSDVLAIGCYDSSFVFINLINDTDGANAWIKSGYDDSGLFRRRSGVNTWRKKVKDIEAFRAAAKKEYDIADSMLSALEPLLGMHEYQTMFSADFLEENEYAEHVQRLFFALPEGTDAAELPNLKFLSSDLSPHGMGERAYSVSAYNTGGASKGLGIVFSGSYVENDEITFHDVRLEYDFTKYPWKTIDIALEKKQIGGMWVYCATLPNFHLPAKVKSGLPPKKEADEIGKRSLRICFTPKGNARKALDICVHLIPLKNPQKQAVYCEWLPFGSKRKYIERMNEFQKKTPEPYRRLLDPNDYDLD